MWTRWSLAWTTGHVSTLWVISIYHIQHYSFFVEIGNTMLKTCYLLHSPTDSNFVSLWFLYTHDQVSCTLFLHLFHCALIHYIYTVFFNQYSGRLTSLSLHFSSFLPQSTSRGAVSSSVTPQNCTSGTQERGYTICTLTPSCLPARLTQKRVG